MKTLIGAMLCGLCLVGCGQTGKDALSSTKSLTGADYHGKKYYFGWGQYLAGEMGNETHYDVTHTQDVFTKAVGGDYLSTALIDQSITGEDIRAGWSDLAKKMQPDDMYVQYSSGHGYPGGLAIGVDYRDMRDTVLALPGKEKIIFDMACYSGTLVDSFNRLQSAWADYREQGKTLFVMASSGRDEESSTGPGTDGDEPGGPLGSAGSAYGHALWKALIGYADGAVDGQKDGVVSLGELISYVVRETQPYGHTPVYTGAYDTSLPIARVPNRAEVERMLGGTAEGQARIAQLVEDRVLRD